MIFFLIYQNVTLWNHHTTLKSVELDLNPEGIDCGTESVSIMGTDSKNYVIFIIYHVDRGLGIDVVHVESRVICQAYHIPLTVFSDQTGLIII